MWRNRRWYLLLVFMTIYLALFYDLYALMVLAYIEAIFPFVSLVCMLITRRKVAVELYADKPAIMKNEEFGIELIIKNKSIFPVSRISLSLTYYNQFSNNIKKESYSVAVENNSELKMICGMPSEYCGNVEFCIADMKLYDMLGIFKSKMPECCSYNVSVLPSTTDISENMLRESTEVFLEEEVYSTRRSGDDPSEIFRVREYAEGDKINRIHWKLSAKEGTLIVKDFGLPLDSSVIILIEMQGVGKEIERVIDALIETAVSLSLHFIMFKQIHFITWYDIFDEDMKRVRIETEDNLYEALSQIYLAAAYKEAYEGLMAYQEKYRTEQYSNLFYITSDIVKDDIFLVREFAKSANCHIFLITEAEDISKECKHDFMQADLSYSLIRLKSVMEDIGGMMLISAD